MSDLQTTCDAIRYFHRRRQFAIKQQMANDRALEAHLRMVLGWSLELPDDDRKAIEKRASTMLKIGEKVVKEARKPDHKRKFVDGSTDDDFLDEWEVIEANINGRTGYDILRQETERHLLRLTQSLPVWIDFACDIRGFGAIGLAKIIGETGPLDRYPKKGHLWKRMGITVINGKAQGKPGKNATKEDWIEHGYNPVRRSIMYVIGDVLVKQGDEYRQIYLDRKVYERERAEKNGLQVVPSAKIPTKEKEQYMSEGHVHNRAQRYMEKRLLKDLWQHWNGNGHVDLA